MLVASTSLKVLERNKMLGISVSDSTHQNSVFDHDLGVEVTLHFVISQTGPKKLS